MGADFLLIRRCLDEPSEKAYYLVFAPPATTLQEMVWAIGQRWHIQEDLEATKDPGWMSTKWCDVYVVQVIVRSDRAVREGTCCSTSSILEQQSGEVTSREKPADNDPQPPGCR